MDCKYTGSSKQRRDQLKVETEVLGDELPFEFGKLSQLRILKAACTFLKKEKHFSLLKDNIDSTTTQLSQILDRTCDFHETIKNDGMLGFIVCFSKSGELIYLSDSITDYLGFNSMDLLLNYDYMHELAHACDKQFYDELSTNFTNNIEGNKFSFYSLLFASKVKRKQTSLSEYKLFKITGHFDTKTQLFIAKCVPVLSVSNRELLTVYNNECFTSIHNMDLKFCQIDDVAESLLGYNLKTDNISEKSLYDLLSIESLQIVSERHRQILISKNTKGNLDPVQLLHKNGFYISCLLNMYFDSTGCLICKYQIMSQTDVSKYTDYVLNFKRDWFLNHSSDFQIKEEEDDSDDYQMNHEDTFHEPYSNSGSSSKRLFDDEYSYAPYEEDYLSSKKKQKIEEESEIIFYEPQLVQYVHTNLCRTASADVKINTIKETLASEIEILRNNAVYFTANSLKHEPEESFDDESCYQEVYNYDSNSYVFYDLNSNDQLVFYPDEYQFNYNKLIDNVPKEVYDDEDDLADHFDFTESAWLESIEEVF